MFVKPREGCKVWYPDGKGLLPADGAEVTDGLHYWHRRLRDGDVLASKPPKPAPAPKPSNGDSI